MRFAGCALLAKYLPRAIAKEQRWPRRRLHRQVRRAPVFRGKEVESQQCWAAEQSPGGIEC